MMETGTYRLGNITFATKEEYLAARLDKKKIDYLQDTDSMDYKQAIKILKKIKTEGISFETQVGEVFLDELELCIRQTKRKRVLFRVKLCCYIVILACASFFLVDGFFEYCSKRNIRFLQQRAAVLKAEFAESEKKMELDEAKRQKLLAEGKRDQIIIDAILPQYREFFAENPYFSGWITIEGTSINYPIMKGPDNEYYLSHNMQNEYDKYGMLVMDKRCSFLEDSPQYIVYGHNAQTGSMFGELRDYYSERYYELHPTILFDTLYESAQYDIVSVFTVSMDEKLDDLDFYKYTEFSSDIIYEGYIEKIKERSIYETDIEPKYGEELLTLVTCDNSVEDGRFVVVAAKRGK